MTISGPAAQVTVRQVVNRWRQVQEWLRRRPLAADGLLAAALAGLQMAVLPLTPGLLGLLPLTALTAAEMAFVAIRRRFQWLAVGGLSAYTAVTLLLFDWAGGGLSVLVVAYTAAAWMRLRPALVATALLWAPNLALAMPVDDQVDYLPDVPRWYLLTWGMLFAVAWFFFGRVVRSRRLVTTALESRARAAEANQQALAAQAVSEERRRIARELHDVVAHHVAVMGVLATGARRAARRDPAAADQALATIEQTGRTALRELRRLLDVLRTDAEPAGELAPQPDLADIEALAEQVREAGLPVSVTVRGEPENLDPGVALTVYRIVQEALTNVLKHAGPATATVELRYGRRWLEVEVADTGHGPHPGQDTVGHGLISMRERVALYGGHLHTGARPGGGFRVYAKMPMDQLSDAPIPSEQR